MPALLARPRPVLPPAPVDDLTRRDLLRGVGLLGAGSVVAGCTTGQTATPQATIRTYTDGYGTDVQIPTAPQRIVTLHSTLQAWPLATLGVPVLATHVAPPDDPTVYIASADPDAAAVLTDTVGLGDTGEIDLERIAALTPDLIIGQVGYPDETQYAALSRITPTVAISRDVDGGRVFGVQRELAVLTGTLDRLEELHAAYDAEVAALRGAYPGMWPRWDGLSVDEYAEGATRYVGALNDSIATRRVFTDLGARITPPAADLGEAEPVAEISLELLGRFDADVVFATPPFEAVPADPDAPLTDTFRTVLQASTAAANDQIYVVGGPWASSNIAGSRLIVADLRRFLDERERPFDTSYGDAG